MQQETMELTLDKIRCGYLDHLTQSLLNMHKTNLFTDVILVSGSKRFYVHRIILCGGSPYFSLLLNGEEMATKPKVVELPDVLPEAVETALSFMYTGFVPDSVGSDNEQLLGLLDVSYLFQVNVLFAYVLQTLVKKMNADYFLELWKVADKYKQEDLVKTVISFVVSSFCSVSVEADFLNLDAEKLRLILSHPDAKLLSVDIIVQGVLKWVKNSPAERSSELADILSLIDLNKLSDKYLKNVLSVETVIKDVPELFHMFASVAVFRLSDCEVSPGVALLSETKLLCCGRSQSDSMISIYHFDEKVWAPPKILPFSLTGGMAMTECEGFLYFIGGGDDPTTASSSAIKYSAAANIIIKILKLKTSSYKAGARSLNGVIHIVGGLNLNGVATRTVQKFHPEGKVCITFSMTNDAHVQPLVVLLLDCLYVVSQNTSSVEKYSPTTDQWTQISTGHQDHLAPSAVDYGGMLYVAKTWHSKTFYVYDPVTSRWQVKKFTGGPESLYGMWSHGLGGPEADFFFVRDGNMALYIYKPKQREWIKLSEAMNSPWNPHQTIICSKRQLF